MSPLKRCLRQALRTFVLATPRPSGDLIPRVLYEKGEMKVAEIRRVFEVSGTTTYRSLDRRGSRAR